MDHELRRYADPTATSVAAATFVLECALEAVERRGAFHLALSGGRTPWAMLENLTTLPMPWARTTIYQVDERVAPEGSDERNLTHLRASLAAVDPRVEAMPVAGDLDEDAGRYAQRLPTHFDLVHLGLGPDGHTASLIPGDPVLDETARLVAPTGPYQGRRRLTLTYPGLARARQLLWLVVGEAPREALAALRRGDLAIPASRVRAERSTIFSDEVAAP
ncbi:MAG: 6-phosphogluconolactonase [Acidobacteriota bacterium]|nr:6-phosphogluconolactonase [Acidobacteriota bacterium]